ncbi:MAG: 2-phosphosulfolactate phosphatase [Calditrichaeota bacterium]|nr:MAG: 2-phosphosulfolactate phosphatase [Calditrichota bacterium]
METPDSFYFYEKRKFDSQEPYRCKLEWGVEGAIRAASRGDILVIVDILSFSTTTTYAVSQGATVYPCTKTDDMESLAEKFHAKIAYSRTDAASKGIYSLSPITFDSISPGEAVILPSLNGSNCSRLCSDAPYVFIGSFLNVSAIADVISTLITKTDIDVTVVACGEREKKSNELRPAIEDYLGAGAIIKKLTCEKSPEALVCESAFEMNENRVAELIWDSVSGRELRAIGFEDDVTFACKHDFVKTVPYIHQDAFVSYPSTTST